MLMVYFKFADNIYLHCLCGSLAGVIATLIASPSDVIKTRMMSSPDSYSGVCNCISRTWKEAGFLAFYKGFVPNIA